MTFIKRYIVERTNKAEIGPDEQSEKAEIKLSGEFKEWNKVEGPIRQKQDQKNRARKRRSSCQENLGNGIQLKGQ